ncbi:hypothetical protein T01_547 [Trichinella spiralis]|uniref:Uncharacterized protein n=1 Tax=Trichinella spiralis TaxID=6334 RepID=A0A0V1AP35_TRISP|nr:hypothetical protein T01_547 [Trichinella spiralis]
MEVVHIVFDHNGIESVSCHRCSSIVAFIFIRKCLIHKIASSGSNRSVGKFCRQWFQAISLDAFWMHNMQMNLECINCTGNALDLECINSIYRVLTGSAQHTMGLNFTKNPNFRKITRGIALDIKNLHNPSLRANIVQKFAPGVA